MSGFVLYDPANQSTSLESFCVRTSKFAGEGRIPHPGRPNLSYPEVVPNETRDETRFTRRRGRARHVRPRPTEPRRLLRQRGLPSGMRRTEWGRGRPQAIIPQWHHRTASIEIGPVVRRFHGFWRTIRGSADSATQLVRPHEIACAARRIGGSHRDQFDILARRRLRPTRRAGSGRRNFRHTGEGRCPEQN
jgi:hypothetical protein